MTPPVVRAISTAWFASCSVTMPSRYTTPASVTTLTCTGLNLLASRKRAFTRVVMSESLVRSASDDGGASWISFTTPRTLAMSRTSASMAARVFSSGASPVSRITRLYGATFTCVRVPKRSLMPSRMTRAMLSSV
jgi:hypothetical protein